MDPCAFCRIIAREAPGSFVCEDDWVCAFLDIQPMQPGHLLVVPRKHATSLCPLSTEKGERMMAVAQRFVRALHEGAGVPCEGVNLFLADGDVAGQEVPHVRLHVIPRRRTDGFGLRFGDAYGARPDRTELDRIAGTLRTRMRQPDPGFGAPVGEAAHD